MNNKITLSALLLAAATTVGFMLPGTAAARDNHGAKREAPVQFAHYDRQRHQSYRHHAPRHVPRWMRHYQRHHAYGRHARPWPRHPGFFTDKHGWKKHYRRMERKHHGHDRSHYPRYRDSNIHFRIDYWD